MRIRVTELTHDDLVSILSGATYDNPYLAIHPLSCESSLDEGATLECREDVWANRLLRGGHILVVDTATSDEMTFVLSLEDILRGCSTKDGALRVAEFLLERHDMLSAYGVMQCAMYGEEVYG